MEKSYYKRALELYDQAVEKGDEKGKGASSIAATVISELELGGNRDTIRKNIYNLIRRERMGITQGKNKTGYVKKSDECEKKSEARPFVLSAWNEDTGKMMDIEEYCAHYRLPRKDVKSYKLVSHTGTPFYNILFKEHDEDLEVDFETIRDILDGEMVKAHVYQVKSHESGLKSAVIKIADLHYGAHIRNLLKTPDYDSEKLAIFLQKIAVRVNAMGFDIVHIHIHGDLIESFSGLNHINSWMSMNPAEIGASAVKLCAKSLHKNLLSKVEGLGEVYIVAGNHDRTSKANDEDVKGYAAELISYALELMGYSTHFHPMILTQQVDGINHIILHGDKGISKRSTKDIIWDYGKQGVFNFVCEGHLHSVIESLSSSQRDKFKVVTDDYVDHRRMHLPSLFTGNFYSESLSFYSNPGYVIIFDNGNGYPDLCNFTL